MPQDQQKSRRETAGYSSRSAISRAYWFTPQVADNHEVECEIHIQTNSPHVTLYVSTSRSAGPDRISELDFESVLEFESFVSAFQDAQKLARSEGVLEGAA